LKEEGEEWRHKYEELHHKGGSLASENERLSKIVTELTRRCSEYE